MKKTLFSLLVIPGLMLAGCNNSPLPNKANDGDTLTFHNKEATPFSLTLPSGFQVQNHSLFPTKEGTFNPIYFSFSKETEDTSVTAFAQKEKDFQAEQCKDDQENCAQVMNERAATINGYDALNYMVQYKSVRPEKEGEHMNNYHTSLKQGENFVHFWTYAGDKENTEEIKKQFDEIVSTISFDPLSETKTNIETSETSDFSFDDFGPNWANNGKTIAVSKDGQSIEILYGKDEQTHTIENLLQTEKDWNQVKCGQTDACGEMKNEKTLKTKKGYDALKFTLEYKGRSLEDQSGSINEFHYSILSPKGNLYQFWTSATDQEKPEEKAALFETFMEAISFNQSL